MTEAIQAILERARGAGWQLLPASEGFRLLDCLGLATPMSFGFGDPGDLEAADVARLSGDQVVLKLNGADLPHKTELGGVQVVPRDLHAIRRAAVAMAERLEEGDSLTFLLQEFVDVQPAPGEEALLSVAWDQEFGVVASFGVGGIHTEILAEHLQPAAALAVHPVDLMGSRDLMTSLRPVLSNAILTRPHRGRDARLSASDLAKQIGRFARLAAPLLATEVDEIEVNPVVVRGHELIGLDVLVRRGDPRATAAVDRPATKIHRLLEPQSIAVVGVSQRLNPGHVIVNNILRQGFDPSRLWVIKPGHREIEGCRCFDSLGELPERADLLIVAVDARQVPDLLQEAIAQRAAEGLIVIPGGLEERSGGDGTVARRLAASLSQARETPWGGPVINGGNCMGIRSAPGRYDTFFLPDHKLPPAGQMEARAAMVAQSGAFLAAKNSKLAAIPFRYSISIGNQLDLTLGDYMGYLTGDPQVRVIGVYVEGFKTLDGRRFLEAATRLGRQGCTVVLYRAGRTQEGSAAAASHSASIAGSYGRTISLARAAGVLIADTLEDFEDLVTLAVTLDGRRPMSCRIGGISNAGFECVVLSDQLGWLQAARFLPGTRRRLAALLDRAGAADLVDVHNPLDVTPMMPDALFAETVEAILDDPEVDVGVVGCVPLTGALNTLAGAPRHTEDIARPGSIANRLIELWRRTDKPWITVVDAGRSYDPLAEALAQAGLPVFRHMDRAMRILECLARHQGEASASRADNPDQG